MNSSEKIEIEKINKKKQTVSKQPGQGTRN